MNSFKRAFKTFLVVGTVGGGGYYLYNNYLTQKP